jgi:predicted  nucleic acid-binding Zn-ribbon protein
MDDSKFSKIESKIDRIADKISNIDVTLVKQQASIDEHIRRTNIAEENIRMIRKELVPVHKHINMLQGGAKVTGIISGVVYATLKLLGKV